MTLLPPEFRFSQHSLSDFADCPRRFYLRYIAKQAWPLLETGPSGMDALTYQAYLRRGSILHRWIERYWVGIGDDGPRTTDDGLPSSVSRLSSSVSDEAELDLWWQRFINTDFADLPPNRLPELELVAPIGEALLYARFDLLALSVWQPSEGSEPSEGYATIIDWKTLRGDNPPSYAFLKNRLQTRIYLYVLATAGAPFSAGQPLTPERCQMRYWLANFPEHPWVEIAYSQAEYEADRNRLGALINDATRRASEAEFEKTSDEKHCTYCNYRTLCRRRGATGAAPPDEETRLLDLENIPTLDY